MTTTRSSYLRPLAALVALVALLGVAGCAGASSSGGNGDPGGGGQGEQQEEDARDEERDNQRETEDDGQEEAPSGGGDGDGQDDRDDEGQDDRDDQGDDDRGDDQGDDQTPALGWNWACEPVGSAVAVDPIFNFGVEPTEHLHQPFCSSMESTLTLRELRAQPNNAKWAANPDKPTNAKNIDWIPAPVFRENRDTFVPVHHVNYYFRKAPKVPVSAVMPPPRGLTVRIGSPDRRDQAHIGWRCGLTHDSFSATQPDCGNKNLKLVVLFPSCSNGEADSADHKSHLRWPGEKGCPDSHPIAIPQLRLEYGLDNDGKRVGFFDHAEMRIAPHADFFNGTPTAVWEDVIERCLDDPKSVGGCAGTGLEGVTNEEYAGG